MSLRRIGVILAVSVLVTVLAGTFGADSIALGQASPLKDPSQNEQTIFNTLRNRYVQNAAGVQIPLNITEILNSLGADNRGQYVLIAEQPCQAGHPVDRAQIWVKTRLVAFNATIAGGRGDGFFGREAAQSTVVEIEEEGAKIKIKKLNLAFYVMMNSQLAQQNEGNNLGQLENDRLFYHEMLHGQIKINDMKKPQWAGWGPLCKCTPIRQWPGVETLIGAGDPYHRLIPTYEDTYMKSVAQSRGCDLETVHITTNVDRQRNFRETITIPPKVLAKANPSWQTIGWNVGAVAVKVQGNTLIVTGRLNDGEDHGWVRVFYDPEDVGMIVYLDVVITVGGEAHLVNKAAVIIPLVGLLAATILGIGILVMRSRRLRT